MIRIPAPYLRGAAVLAIGATFVLGHAAFAAPQAGTKAEAPMPMAAADSHEGEDRLQQVQNLVLAENCYLEVQKHRTPQGKRVPHRA